MKSSQSSYATESIVDEADESTESEALSEGQLYDFITNQPVQDSPVERTLQTVARSLVDEYGFDHTQLARDQSLTYELIDGDGKSRKARQRVSVAVFPEGIRKTDASQIIRACLVQPPTTKANDPKRGVDLLEQVMGALPACDYGLWTNGTDLIFKQKLTGGGRLQPEYVDLYDLPGYAETAADLDRVDRQAGRIATGDNLQRTFARVHDYIYGNQGLKKDAAYLAGAQPDLLQDPRRTQHGACVAFGLRAPNATRLPGRPLLPAASGSSSTKSSTTPTTLRCSASEIRST